MASLFEKPMSPDEQTLVTVGARTVGENFYQDAIRNFGYRLADGPLMDTQNKPVPLALPVPGDDEHEEKLKTWVAQGYERLIQMCGGNEKEARALTLCAHQGVLAGFFFACPQDTNSPLLHLPDGTPGLHVKNPDTQENVELTELTFSIGQNGRPQIEVNYRLSGGGSFLRLDTGVTSQLSPESYSEAQFRGELGPDGALILLGDPSCRFDLRLAEQRA
jgi:hypothetical protein